jgi:DNA-binding NarL/FixJ family response regulator
LTQAGHTIAGVAGDVEKALSDPGLAGCQVVVLDLSLGDGDATRHVARLTGAGRRVLACSMHEEAARIRRAFAAGVSGYVTKRETAQHLLEAVARVAAGEDYVSPRVQAALLADGPQEPRALDLSCLSDRERDVLRLLSEGAGPENIARELSISPRTVEGYYARINEKLGIRGAKDLRRLAIMAAREGQL